MGYIPLLVPASRSRWLAGQADGTGLAVDITQSVNFMGIAAGPEVGPVSLIATTEENI
jgi:hypothetical protein